MQHPSNQAMDPTSARDGVVVEWAPFRLATGVTEAALLDAADTLQREFLERQPGFVRRELLHGADGQWADLVVWQDESSAANAMQASTTSSACATFFPMLVLTTEDGVSHFHRVRTYRPFSPPDIGV
jgi:hypothetical protein